MLAEIRTKPSLANCILRLNQKDRAQTMNCLLELNTKSDGNVLAGLNIPVDKLYLYRKGTERNSFRDEVSIVLILSKKLCRKNVTLSLESTPKPAPIGTDTK